MKHAALTFVLALGSHVGLNAQAILNSSDFAQVGTQYELQSFNTSQDQISESGSNAWVFDLGTFPQTNLQVS